MPAHSFRILTRFNGRYVELETNADWIAAELRRLLPNLIAAPIAGRDVDFRVALTELEPSWIEVRDSTGRSECGPFDRVVHYARRWLTDAFVTAHPGLLWLHASAAALNDSAVLMTGPPGAGKSTLLVRLVDRGWRMLAEDVVPVDLNSGAALPFPFSPSIRTKARDVDTDLDTFLEQEKVLVSLLPDQVSAEATSVAAIVLPEYSRQADRPALVPLTVVSAAHALASQCLFLSGNRVATMSDVFRLAQSVPCSRLSYRDATIVADELTRRWSRGFVTCPAACSRWTTHQNRVRRHKDGGLSRRRKFPRRTRRTPDTSERQKDFTRRALLRAGWVLPAVTAINIPSASAQTPAPHNDIHGDAPHTDNIIEHLDVHLDSPVAPAR